jgi:23S rRNA pseudouridine1911/1915/1917 synthase
MKLNILYEDNHLIAVEKKPGILTQNDYRGIPSLMDHVKDYLKATYIKPGQVYLGLVHRLDRPVSGIILFARTSKAASRLSRQFRQGETEKFYLAVTSPVNKDVKNEWISLSDSLNRKRDITIIDKSSSTKSKEASLDYRIIETYESSQLLLIRLLTGRKHQIRAQLSSRGMHIIGDMKYGSTIHLPDDQILLHASRLIITHPTTKERLILKSNADKYFKTGSVNPVIEKEIDNLISEFI